MRNENNRHKRFVVSFAILISKQNITNRTYFVYFFVVARCKRRTKVCRLINRKRGNDGWWVEFRYTVMNGYERVRNEKSATWDLEEKTFRKKRPQFGSRARNNAVFHNYCNQRAVSITIRSRTATACLLRHEVFFFLFYLRNKTDETDAVLDRIK